MSEQYHKLATIVFTDIVGFTQRMDKNEQETMLLLQKQREIILPLVKIHKGRIIKEIGDGFLIIFESTIEAVRFTIKLQKNLKDEELTIRAGIHNGEVIYQGDDVFGAAVNIAARIEPLAKPNCICISEDVRTQIKNKDEFQTISLGTRDLKGVQESVRIYELITDLSEKKKSRRTIRFLGELWSRRVVHILLVYIILAFLIKQTVAAIVYNYLLSSHLIDLTWTVLLSLLPTVFIVAYFHVGLRRKRWHKAELIGLPINLVFSLFIIMLLFKGKDLGAATRTLQLENEQGESIEKVIPKEVFQKNIALFFLQNQTHDSSLNWLEYGIPSILQFDLSQNQFLRVSTPARFANKFTDLGFRNGEDAPLRVQREVASYYQIDYFISGTFHVSKSFYEAVIKLYNTKSSELITEFTIRNSNIFSLVDAISSQLCEGMESVCKYEGSVNLPVSEIYTPSETAAKYFILGEMEVSFNNNYTEAIDFIVKAIEEDEDFIPAYLKLSLLYFENNQYSLIECKLKKVLDNIYKLPDRSQYRARYIYYYISQEPEKAIAVLLMWEELFPEDIEVHNMLATKFQYSSRYADAIKQYKIIYKLDPDQSISLSRIGDLYQILGIYDSALSYFEKYGELNPEDYKTYVNLGELHLQMGNLELATSSFDKGLILDPFNIYLSLDRLEVDIRTGNIDHVEEGYFKLLEESRTSSDSSRIYSSLSDFYAYRGQVIESLEYLNLYIGIMKSQISPLQNYVLYIFNIHKFVQAQKSKEALALLDEARIALAPPVNKIVAFGYIQYYIELDSAERARDYFQEAEEMALNFGEDQLLNNIMHNNAELLELQTEYENALNAYLEYQHANPAEKQVYIQIARCYRHLNKLKKAEKAIQQMIDHYPAFPKANLEAAYIYREKGQQVKALEHIKITLAIWEDADPIFVPAQEARALLNDLLKN